jgi:hypothetical protein
LGLDLELEIVLELDIQLVVIINPELWPKPVSVRGAAEARARVHGDSRQGGKKAGRQAGR